QKLRGRRKSLTALADLVASDILDAGAQTIAIGHGSAPEDAQRLRELIAERVEVGDVLMLEVGPVIGSHTGPGMVSVVFWGPQRES
ncbi:MAG: fatty acid-binding protein DegV, partial [Actinobacteria bacterium]